MWNGENFSGFMAAADIAILDERKFYLDRDILGSSENCWK